MFLSINKFELMTHETYILLNSIRYDFPLFILMCTGVPRGIEDFLPLCDL